MAKGGGFKGFLRTILRALLWLQDHKVIDKSGNPAPGGEFKPQAKKL